MDKSDKVVLSKYEVSVIGMLVLTLLPTVGVLLFQVIAALKAEDSSNFRIYFVTGITFFIFLLFSMWLCVKYAREAAIPKKFLYSGFVLLSVIHILLLVKCYLNSSTVYPALSGEWFPWHNKSDWKVFCLMLGISVLGVLAFLWTGKQRKVLEILRYPAYILASAIAGFSAYAPNWAANDKMHGSAYYVSVYNALMNEPYTYSNQSIYGHYAILLKYPVKWLGGDYTAFNIVITVVCGVSLFFVALALDLCIKNHFISMIAVWAVPVMFLYYPLNHWQMFPHRVLFAGVELYLLAVLFNKKKALIKAVGYFVCCLAMLWNMETGIVCLGVWAVACIVYEDFYLRTEWNWKHFGKSVIRSVMYSVFTVVGLIGIFNVYNMPLGEQWHGLRFMLYPHIMSWDMPEKIVVQAAGQTAADNALTAGSVLLSWDGGFVTGLSIQFPVQISYWYFVFLLMGMAIILYVVRLVYCWADTNDHVIGMAAVLALGQLTYFVNRPCFDYLAIAFFEAVLIMAVIADRQWDRTKGLAYGERGMQILFVSILSILSVLTVWQAYFRISGRVQEKIYDRTEFTAIAEEIEKKVPKDTYAIGMMGAQEIYAELGWDTQIHVMDFMAFGCTGGDWLETLVLETAKQEECIVCIRSKKSEERETIQHFMERFLAYEEQAITVKEFWDLDIDEDWYYDIYYLGLDHSVENVLVELYGDKKK